MRCSFVVPVQHRVSDHQDPVAAEIVGDQPSGYPLLAIAAV
jgi:hypothetical protein